MKTWARPLAAALVLSFGLTACGGGGRSIAGGSLPGTVSASGKGTASITLTIPGASNASGTSITHRAPQTISSETQSITVSVNGGTPQVFNATAPTCTTSQNGLTCTLVVGAPYGNDGFLVITYSGGNGTGTPLNVAAFTLNVTQGGTNTASATAGNLLVVNSSSDGSGSGFSCSGGTCTLREAIAEAGRTAGVYTAIMFQNVSTITVSSPIEIGHTAAQNIILLGPGATVPSPGVGAPTASSGLTISGGSSSGILKVDSGSFLSVVGLTLANGNNTVDDFGGAIENNGGTLAIVNTIFSGNTTGNFGSGGAVYDSGGGSGSTIATSTFTNNVSEYGGAYYIESNSAGASFSHCLFNTNTAFYAPDLYGEGGAIDTYANLSVDNSIFTGNIAGSTSVSETEGDGGAVAIWDNTVSPSITNSIFGGSASTGNFAGGPDSTAFGYGGAIENDGSNPIVLGGDMFSFNVAKGGNTAEGGAIDDYLGISSTGDTFANNVADGTAAGSDGSAYGGAVYSEDSPTSFTQATFSNNAANAAYECDGGGLYAYRPSVALALSNVQFSSNICSGTNASTDYAYAYGGALEVDYGLVSFGNVTFSSNMATASTGGNYYGSAYGGGFELYDQTNIDAIAHKTPQATRHAHVNARKTQANIQARIAQRFARLQAIKSRHVSANSKRAAAVAARRAPAARAASIRRAQSLPANGFDTVTFSGNTANGGPNGGVAYGGGADLSGSPTFNAVSFTGNTATASGNSAYGVGGAMSFGESDCVTRSQPVIATITGNSALNAGGGIYNECGALTIATSTISGNKVTAVAFDGDGGGGVWAFNSTTIVQSTITGNGVAGSVVGAGGGGVMNYDTAMSIVNSTIFANTSAADGGGVENGHGNVGASQLTLTNDTIYQNSASGVGGNLNNQNDAGSNVVFLANTIIAGGTASSQPDIYNADTLTSMDYNLVQQSANYGPGSSNAPLSHDRIGVDPALSALASNGGPTQTLADTSSSPGKGWIPFSGGLCNGAAGTNVDQRGFNRGAGGVCDIGAFELSGTAP